ncbi:579_t:CDS:2, partial [Funneliformis caledonium]
MEPTNRGLASDYANGECNNVNDWSFLLMCELLPYSMPCSTSSLKIHVISKVENKSQDFNKLAALSLLSMVKYAILSTHVLVENVEVFSEVLVRRRRRGSRDTDQSKSRIIFQTEF